jgi:hypothetical protein
MALFSTLYGIFSFELIQNSTFHGQTQISFYPYLDFDILVEI